MDRDPLDPQRFGEGVVLLLGLLGPHDVVEEQLTDVVRGQPRQLEPRPMDDGLTQLADLRIDTKRHSGASCRDAVVVC